MPDRRFHAPARLGAVLRVWWLLPLLAALVAAFVGWGMRHFYVQREQHYHHLIESSLSAINQLQVRSVAAWRQRRLGEAEALSDDSALAAAVASWRAAPAPVQEGHLRDRLRGLVEHMQYTAAYLMDPQGRLLLDTTGTPPAQLPAREVDALRAALQLGQPVSTGLQRGGPFSFAYFGLVAPLFDGAQPVGAIWLVMDARATLYPLLEAWPMGNHTSAESLLVERQGDQLVFLSPLRHRESEPLTLQAPVRDPGDSTVALAVAGMRGTLYGTDYRGRPVLATASAVPSSDWLLISKIDTEEALAEAARGGQLSLTLFASLAALLLGVLVVLWQWRAWRRERALKERLEYNMRWLEAAQRAASVGYFAYDAQAHVFTMSAMANAIFGLPADCAMTLKQWIALMHPDDRDRTLQEHGKAMSQRLPLRLHYRIHPQDGTPMRWVEVRAEYGRVHERGSLRMTGTLQDVTERRQAEEQLERYRAALEAQVRIDPLTQLANRLALDEQVAFEWERASRSHQPLALLMIDVDRFKAFNDHYGHMAGDRCLQGVAQALLTTMGRAGDMVARYGGEEFAVLLPGANEDQACAVADRLRQAVRALRIDHAAGGLDHMVTISIGVTSLQPAVRDVTTGAPRHGIDVAYALFRQADAALYQAKRQGRDRCVLYSPEDELLLHDFPDSLL